MNKVGKGFIDIRKKVDSSFHILKPPRVHEKYFNA